MELANEKEEESPWGTLVPIAQSALMTFRGAAYALKLGLIVMQELENEEREGDYSVNTIAPKIERLRLLRTGHISLYKHITGFYQPEFETLSSQVFRTIALRKRHEEERLLPGRPTKLNPSERLLSCIMYLKARTGLRREINSWNYSKTSLYNDIIHVCMIINELLAHEVA
ncbi:hypothetical protein BWQ96_06080 [Gracilariopsis chorda]|uniref:Uncharacterized protein n=1 Tax=Gracilariopsis chorda TaxID=448386 RepID=A0A2V3IQ07_9FLOR|nr:hypothetical protein BWQ96_06080 [Gracilariopsis chorda]|eukprot:PXF44171.1 hypothetical protein BWQ96_06080 [Gracilariopsis chorda]